MSERSERTDSTSGTRGEDVAALRAERDALAQEVAVLRRSPAGRVRMTAVGVLVAVAWIALALAPVAVWARTQVLQTDRWVAVAGPLATEPAVQRAVADWATGQLVDLVQPEQLLRDALPDRADALSAPLAQAVVGFVHDRVLAYVRSDEFSALWEAAVARAHETALRLLEGDAPNVSAGTDRVTIDLLPLLQRVLDRLTATTPELFGREIDIPDVDLEDVPPGTAERLGDAFGVEAPEDLGRITVYDRGRLRSAQDALRWLGRLVGLVVLVAIAAPLAAVALSARRGRTALLLVAGTLVGAVLVRKGTALLLDELLARIATADARAVASRLADRLVAPLLDGLAVVVGVTAAVLVVAYLCGSHRGAVRVRRTIAGAAGSGWALARAHRPVAQVVVGVAGLVLLLAVDTGWLASLVLLAAVAAAVWGLTRLPAPPPPEPPPG